ncbi:unnamed protein product [Ambrosiozyma monospora]|uniref:Unnamed protein product n=1 Tax=Ambrosiozyma monospora TaxID=43982 RepID=A0ACB5SW06_AMBMO|nr:unnamed protein product [Ambrosiozyma monospora]
MLAQIVHQMSDVNLVMENRNPKPNETSYTQNEDDKEQHDSTGDVDEEDDSCFSDETYKEKESIFTPTTTIGRNSQILNYMRDTKKTYAEQLVLDDESEKENIETKEKLTDLFQFHDTSFNLTPQISQPIASKTTENTETTAESIDKSVSTGPTTFTKLERVNIEENVFQVFLEGQEKRKKEIEKEARQRIINLVKRKTQ